MNAKNSSEITSQEKLPISALVVTLNESHFLDECLSSISFCEEILVVDLGSIDESTDIAKKYGAKVVSHEKVPSSEYIRPIFAPTLKNDWVLVIDPDEVVKSDLLIEIRELFNEIKDKSNISDVIVPWVFYFKNYKLKGTPWGGDNSKALIINNKNFEFVPQIHNGQRRSPNSIQVFTPKIFDEAYLQHKWMSGWLQFMEKHRRYLKAEAEARYKNDSNPKISKLLISPIKEFLWAYFKKKGFMDGFTGLFLSVFWAWYQTSARYRHIKFARLKKFHD